MINFNFLIPWHLHTKNILKELTMKKKYQVFISSTYSDLIEERAAATQCLLDNYCIPVGMEQFPASGMKQMEYIKKMLDDCDYYILILGGRYGSLDEDGISFTEKEYDYANTKDIPIMSFVYDHPENLPSKNCETIDIMREKYSAFRAKVCSDRLVKFHSNIGDLRTNIVTSINHCINDFPAVGWVRGNSVTELENFRKKILSVIEEHSITRQDIDNMIDKKAKQTHEELQKIKNEVNSIPKIHIGTEPPKDLKNGDFWVQID